MQSTPFSLCQSCLIHEIDSYAAEINSTAGTDEAATINMLDLDSTELHEICPDLLKAQISEEEIILKSITVL